MLHWPNAAKKTKANIFESIAGSLISQDRGGGEGLHWEARTIAPLPSFASFGPWPQLFLFLAMLGATCVNRYSKR